MGQPATLEPLATRAPGATRKVRIPLLVLVVLAALSGSFWHPAEASEMDESDAIQRATGSFEVTLKPLDAYNTSADAKVARMSIDKSFAGDLVATSRGEMLSGGSPAEGSAGYVAIERVTGTLDGRAGSFLLQHSGTMTPESQELTITVIPASGTGELEGLAGTMSIEIEEGHHLYSFEYTLTAKP